jgi:hypothetical protein
VPRLTGMLRAFLSEQKEEKFDFQEEYLKRLQKIKQKNQNSHHYLHTKESSQLNWDYFGSLLEGMFITLCVCALSVSFVAYPLLENKINITS